jgi:hypothetical protein
MHVTGKGVAMDFAEGDRLIRLAAAQGHARALSFVARKK